MLVIANGMPRSGSTLQYNALLLLLTHGKAGQGEGYVAPNHTRASFVSTEQLTEWAEDAPYHLVKTHPVHPDLAALLAGGRTYVCYIYRDLRDVAVSRLIAWGDKGETLFEGLDRSVDWYWQLRDFRDAHPNAVLWQRYQDVTANLASAIRETADFLGINLSEHILADIAAACSVEAVKPLVEKGKEQLRALLQELRSKDPKLAGTYLQMIGRGGERASIVFHEDRTLLNYNHISPHMGAVGTWKTRLDEETQRTIVDRYADWYVDAYRDGVPE